MDPIASIGDKLKSFANSGENFINGLTGRQRKKSRQNPIEILKRLQREAFADLMKLRDRQEKVERVLTSYKALKGGPFQEHSTSVRGEVDVLGAVFLMDYPNQEYVDTIKRSGIRTGVDAKITFETKVRENDLLEADFISGRSNHGHFNNALGSALSLARVSYKANITDWCSMNAIPMGARCRDVSISTDSLFKGKGLSDYSSFGPPLLHQDLGSAFGLTLKESHIATSLGAFVADLPGSFGHCFSSFGQIVCQLPKSTVFSLFALRQKPYPRQQATPGTFTLPLSNWLRRNRFEESTVAFSPIPRTNVAENNPTGSVAAMLESELDESTRIRGWVQMRDNPEHLQWSVSMSDLPEDEIGWGLSLGGSTQGSKSWDHFQVEAFLKFNLSKKLSLQPGVVYLMDGTNQAPALICRSTWSI